MKKIILSCLVFVILFACLTSMTSCFRKGYDSNDIWRPKQHPRPDLTKPTGMRPRGGR
jgi:hypothetical protein